MIITESFEGPIEKISNQLIGWYESSLSILPNIILSILIAGLAYFAVRYIKKGAKNVLGRLVTDVSILNLIANLIAIIFSIATLFIILGVLNLDKALNTFLATAGVAGLAIGLALQEPLTNIFSGVLLSVRKMYNIGDLIETNGYFGTITDISLKATTIKLLSGEIVYIPNKQVLQKPIKNYSIAAARRVELMCGVSYADDLSEVRAIVEKTLTNLTDIAVHRPVEVYFSGFGGSSIDLIARFWIAKKDQASFLAAKSNAIIAIKNAFDAKDISIPFPITTLDFGLTKTERMDKQFDSEQIQSLLSLTTKE